MPRPYQNDGTLNTVPTPESPSERKSRIRQAYGLEPKRQPAAQPAKAQEPEDLGEVEDRLQAAAGALGLTSENDPELKRLASKDWGDNPGRYWAAVADVISYRAQERQWAQQQVDGSTEEPHRAPAMDGANSEISRITAELSQIHAGVFGSPSSQDNQARRAALRKKLAGARRG